MRGCAQPQSTIAYSAAVACGGLAVPLMFWGAGAFIRKIFCRTALSPPPPNTFAPHNSPASHHHCAGIDTTIISMQPSGSYDGGSGAVRARKPYTITKAREKWTDGEHLKFVEAIKLFGRSWKKIEGAGC